MQTEIDSIKSEYQQQSETGRSQDSRGAGSLYEVESPHSKDDGYDQNGFGGYDHQPQQQRSLNKDLENDSHEPDEVVINGQHFTKTHGQSQNYASVQLNGHTFQQITPLDQYGTSQKDLRSREHDESDNYLPEIPEGGANTEQGSPTAGSSNLTHTVWVSPMLTIARDQKLLHRGQKDVQQRHHKRNTEGTAERSDLGRRRLSEAHSAAV